MVVFDNNVIQSIREIFGISNNCTVNIRKVNKGYNIRIHEQKRITSKKKRNSDLLSLFEPHELCCRRCACVVKLHPHHIVSQNQGGGDEKDNIMILCFDHHTGDEGIHYGYWTITDVISEEKLTELRKRYKVIR